MDYNFILNRYSQIRKVISRELSLVEKLKKYFYKKKIDLSKQSKPNFFFIGLQKCGSSWLSEIFQIDNYITTVNEMHFFDSLIDKKIFFQKFKNNNSGNLKILAYKSLDSEFMNLYDDKNFMSLDLKYYQNYVYEEKKRLKVKYLADETPEYIFFLEYLSQNFPDTKKVLILRNPKDRIISRFYNEKRKNRMNENKITNFFINSFLTRVDLEYEHLLNNKEKIYILTFENLRKNFSQEIYNLTNFLNLSLDKKKIDEIMIKTEINNLKKTKPSSVFRKGKIGEYNEYLDDQKIKFINQMFLSKHLEIEKKFNLKLDKHYFE